MMKFMTRGGLAGLLCLMIAIGAGAQPTYNSSGNRVGINKRKQEKHGFDKDRLIYGLGIPGLSFYSGVFSIGLAPAVGYRITENFSAGVSLGFQYVSARNYYEFYDPTNNVKEYHPLRIFSYMPGIWTRYVIYKNFFAAAEAEYSIQRWKEFQLDANNYPESVTNHYDAPVLLLGGGLRQPVSDRSSLVIMGLYDVIQDKYSPYLNGLDLRIGFNVGF